MNYLTWLSQRIFYSNMSNRTAVFRQVFNGVLKDTSNEVVPIVRQGHVSVLHENKEVFVFSGRIPGDGSGQRAYIHDFWKYTIADNKWCKLALDKTKSPRERHSHSAVLYKNKIFVFGGSNNDSYFGDLWSFNIDTNEWNLLTDSKDNQQIKHMPTPRHGHSATVYKNLMIIFGGKYGYNSRTYFNDTYAFNMDNCEWVNFETSNSESIPPRCWHTCTLVNKYDLLYLYAGFKIEHGEIYYDTSWILDLNTMKWSDITKLIKGKTPHTRNRHISVNLSHLSNDTCEYILHHSGNFMDTRDEWLKDVFMLMFKSPSSYEWIQLDIDESKILESNVPISRGQHTAHYKSDSNEILFFGGEYERKRFNDIISIEVV